jgi:4-hydroxybenzoate polyprenyltransferase
MSNPLIQTKKVSVAQKAKAIIRLTRWREHVPYTIPIVIVGALMSGHINNLALNWRLFPVLFANILAMCFAFMINDIEDAPDDAREPRKKANNVISSGIISYAEGISLSITIFIIALVLYALGGWKTFSAGGVTLVLCYLYSVSPFRLKARPIVDIVSHGTMLSGLLMLSGYLIYDAYPKGAWFMIVAVTLGSVYGQFYNQLDDFNLDKKAGLQNTAMLLGRRMTQALMYLSVVSSVICFTISMGIGAYPEWLGPIALVIIFTLLMFRWQSDMRGKEAESSGQIQIPILLGANIVALIWLVQEMGLLVISQ